MKSNLGGHCQRMPPVAPGLEIDPKKVLSLKDISQWPLEVHGPSTAMFQTERLVWPSQASILCSDPANRSDTRLDLGGMITDLHKINLQKGALFLSCVPPSFPVTSILFYSIVM